MYLDNKVIKMKNVLCFLLIFPFIEPLLFKEPNFVFIDKFYTIFKIISLFVVLFLNLKDQSLRKFKINFSLLCLFCFEGIIGISTILHNGDFVKFCGPVVNTIGLSLITVYFYPKLKIDFFKQFMKILIILTIVNDFSVILFPKGITKNAAWTSVYFLGIDNRFVFFYLPLIFFVSIYDIQKKSKLSSFWYFVCFLTIFPLIYLWSVGAMLGLIILIVSLICFLKTKKISNINFSAFFTIILMLNILIVFLNIQNYFSDFIINILKKDITLSGRTYLWENAFEMFYNNPILGFGIQSNSILSKMFYGGVTHPHNLFLTYLIEGGIIGITFYLMFIWQFIKNTRKIRNRKIKFIFNITVFTVFLLSLVDTLDIGLMYVIIILGIIYYEVENEKEEDRNINVT